MSKTTSICADIHEIAELMHELDPLVQAARQDSRAMTKGRMCITCGNTDVHYDKDCGEYWCGKCEDYANLRPVEQRELSGGRVKNTLTGIVTEKPWRERDEFDRPLGSNKW